jgi:hypothetical protein
LTDASDSQVSESSGAATLASDAAESQLAVLPDIMRLPFERVAAIEGVLLDDDGSPLADKKGTDESGAVEGAGSQIAGAPQGDGIGSHLPDVIRDTLEGDAAPTDKEAIAASGEESSAAPGPEPEPGQDVPQAAPEPEPGQVPQDGEGAPTEGQSAAEGEPAPDEEERPPPRPKPAPPPVPTLPGELPSVVYHHKDSIVYRTLTLQPLPPTDSVTRAALVVDLRTYVDICSERGLINEASYITDIIEVVKKCPEPTSVNKRLARAREELAWTEAEVAAQND